MDKVVKAEMEKEFRQALPKARMMMTKNVLSKEDLNKLYGLFQQATQGNCNDWKIFGSMNLVDLDSKAKFNAWVANRGLSKHEAMQRYASEVNILATKYAVVFPTSRSQFGSASSFSTSTTPSVSDVVDSDTPAAVGGAGGDDAAGDDDSITSDTSLL